MNRVSFFLKAFARFDTFHIKPDVKFNVGMNYVGGFG